MEYLKYHNITGVAAKNATGLMKGTQGAPVLLNELIFMVLPAPADQQNNLYSIQASVQTVLIVVALICIPVMMFAKPYFLWRDNKKKTKHTIVHHTDEEESEVDPILAEEPAGGHGHGHGEFQFSEIMVHQALETIEFVLGSVSHTASYLRLWALSLAHSELATVFWMKVMFLLIGLAPKWNDVDATKPSNTGLPFIATAFFVFIGWSIWFFCDHACDDVYGGIICLLARAASPLGGIPE